MKMQAPLPLRNVQSFLKRNCSQLVVLGMCGAGALLYLTQSNSILIEQMAQASIPKFISKRTHNGMNNYFVNNFNSQNIRLDVCLSLKTCITVQDKYASISRSDLSLQAASQCHDATTFDRWLACLTMSNVGQIIVCGCLCFVTAK